MNRELVSYIENNIFPLYEKNDKAHQMWHIRGVIDRSLEISKQYDINLDMVYTIAAFHDLGNYINRENHERESAKIFISDTKINSFFNDAQIIVIREAIEDHRASLTNKHRSIYGKIIATADKFITIDDVLKSVHLHTLENFPNVSWEQKVELCYKYLNKKYGENGYARIPLPYLPYEKFLVNIRKLLKNKELLATALFKVDSEIKKENL